MRYRTGKGVDLEVTMFDVMADWMNMAYAGIGILEVRQGGLG